MQVERFRESPMGTLVPISGHDAYLGRDYNHWAFVPSPLGDCGLLSERSYKDVADAALAIGRLDFAVRRLPTPALLVRPALRREAQSTSALEGTYATLDEVLEADYLEERAMTAEVAEVLNYVAAAEMGLELIKEKPICLTLISQLQQRLVRGTRGDGFDAGRLRESQVYIGEQVAGIERSRFVPPPPGDTLVQGMSEWEKWLNADDDVPLLVKCAVGHYQFEALHPFSDGNGRLGRLIVALQLTCHEALAYPILNLSPWLKEREDEYKDHLLRISETGALDPWVQFFCQAVKDQADDGVARIGELLSFRENVMQQLHHEGVRGVAISIADSLLGYPLITPSQAAKLHGVTYPPANKAITRLVELGILREVTGRSYGRIYVCDAVMQILRRP